VRAVVRDGAVEVVARAAAAAMGWAEAARAAAARAVVATVELAAEVAAAALGWATAAMAAATVRAMATAAMGRAMAAAVLGRAMAAAKALPAVKAFQAEAGRAWAEAVRVRGSYRRHLLDTKDQHIFRHASRHRQGYAPLLGSRWVSLDRHWRGIGRGSRCVLASCIALCRIVWAPPSRMARLDGSMTLGPR
jgi:hypothetical protein